MYNRYIRNDRNEYAHIPAQNTHTDRPPPQGQVHYSQHEDRSRNDSQSHDRHDQTTPPGSRDKKSFLSSLFGKLKLDDLDTGDLLLIAVIILLFKESEDEELLIALVLLLIL